MVFTETLVIIGTVLGLTYWYINRIFTYWKRKGVQYAEPSIPFGNMKGAFKTIHITDVLTEQYNRMKAQGPFGGIYLFHSPVALIFDTKLIKNILIKDFQYFMDRGMYYNEKDDPLSAHLFSLEAVEWKELRSKISPTFTSGKMKYMFPIVTKVSNEFKEALEKSVEISSEVEVKDYLGRFTTDVIGNCAFGIECNSLKDPDAIFRKMGKRVFEPSRFRIFISFVSSFSTTLSKFIGVRVIEEDIADFFLKVVKDTMNFREKNHVKNNDFLDLMIQLNKTKSESSKNFSDGLSFNQVAAQAFVFFLAGFETSSTLMTFALYELAVNKDIQIKVREEIDDILKKHNGEFTYEAMLEMKYLEQVLNESLRKHPPVPFLLRRTTRDYPVPDTNFTLPINQQVWFPIHAIQHDPEHYPNPEKFDPDRFTPEAIQARDPMTFLPFGDGPRNCIGLRFGLMQARIGIVTILQNFDVSPGRKTQIPLIMDPESFNLSPLGGMWLNFKKLGVN